MATTSETQLILSRIDSLGEKVDENNTLVSKALVEQAMMRGQIDLHAHRLGTVETTAKEAKDGLGQLAEKTGTFRLIDTETERKKLEEQLAETRGLKRGIIAAIAAGVVLASLAFLGGLAWRSALATERQTLPVRP